MKKHIFIFTVSLLLAAPAFAQRRAASVQNSDRLVTVSDSVSFAIGFLAAKGLTDEYPEVKNEIDLPVFLRAFEQGLGGGTGWLDEEKLESYVEAYFDAKRKTLYQANIEAGERFLAENRLDPEVYETASGLQYRIVEPGRNANERPRPYDDMHITYTGTTLDGKVFARGGDEYSYPASEIDGLSEGTQLMSPGAKYIFYIPAGLAYGEDGNDDEEDGPVPPYSVVIYEVYMNSMTRDHSYYDEDEDTQVDMDTWSAESEESGPQDDSQPLVFPAGDYTATTLPNRNRSVSIDGLDRDEIVKMYETEGFTVATTQERVIVLDSEGFEILHNMLDEDSNSYDSYYLTEYRADDGTGPVFLVLDFGFEGGSYYGSMLYVIENGRFHQTDKYLALINDEGNDERLTPILSLHRGSDGVEFRFDSDDLRYDPIGNTLSVAGEDFWYVYRNGQITEAGPATTLSRFRNRE